MPSILDQLIFMTRYFVEVSYLGTAYHGWQRQPTLTQTVQHVLEEKLSILLRDQVAIVASGRTDAGVHCRSQVFHMDCKPLADLARFRFQLNKFLPPDIAIHRIAEVPSTAHARFDALRRSYLYQMHYGKDVFSPGLSYQLRREVDIDAANQAATQLLGRHNFYNTSKTKTDVATYFCEIFACYWTQEGTKVSFHIVGNRFLRGMVRIVVGNLLRVGLGEVKPEKIALLIEPADTHAKEAKRHLVPAHGLYLNGVQYPSYLGW